MTKVKTPEQMLLDLRVKQQRNAKKAAKLYKQYKAGRMKQNAQPRS